MKLHIGLCVCGKPIEVDSSVREPMGYCTECMKEVIEGMKRQAGIAVMPSDHAFCREQYDAAMAEVARLDRDLEAQKKRIAELEAREAELTGYVCWYEDETARLERAVRVRDRALLHACEHVHCDLGGFDEETEDYVAYFLEQAKGEVE